MALVALELLPCQVFVVIIDASWKIDHLGVGARRVLLRIRHHRGAKAGGTNQLIGLNITHRIKNVMTRTELDIASLQSFGGAVICLNALPSFRYETW